MNQNDMPELQKNLEAVRSNILRACEKSKRNPSEIALIGVTKTVEVDRIKMAYDLGLRKFGENKAQELLRKKPGLPEDIEWHFIGNLQTNKVKSVVGQARMIQSVDRMPLVEALQKQAENQALTVDILLEVNASGEATKHGFAPEQVLQQAEQISRSFNKINLRGLMTIGPLTEDKVQIAKAFRQTADLFKQCQQQSDWEQWNCLSMGMSHDYELAIEAGATMVRIGSAIFGDRKK